MSASLVLIGCADSASLETLGVDDVEISGVYLGMSEEEVAAHLGEPDAREDLLTDRTEFYYTGLDVSLISGGSRLDSPKVVWGVWARTPEHCFGRDICPGDTLAEIRKTLGPADIEAQTKDKPKRLFYPLPKIEACWVWILTEDNETASEIRLACQP